MCAPHAFLAPAGDPKRLFNPLGMELQTAVKHHVGTPTKLGTSAKVASALPSLQPAIPMFLSFENFIYKYYIYIISS